MNSNQQSKVAYITGGSKGIGFAIAQRLLQLGHRVAITSRSEDNASSAARELGNHENLLSLVSDVRKLEDERKAVEAITNKWGQLDILIANAGLGRFGSVEDLTPEEWNEVIDTNLTGVFYSLKACMANLKESQGYFITIASLAGTNFFAGGSAYNASKFGLVGFTQAAMLDLRKYGIKTSTIMPGSVNTQFNGRTPSADQGWKIQPEDIAQIVEDLLNMHPRTLPSKIEVRPTIPPGS